jgi:hypothetical protein
MYNNFEFVSVAADLIDTLLQVVFREVREENIIKWKRFLHHYGPLLIIPAK